MTESNRYLSALLNGNEEVTAEIYSKYYPKISSFILRNKGKEEDVEDAIDALIDSKREVIEVKKRCNL